MEVLVCHIKIGSLNFDFVHKVTVESTWKELTQKATILLPAALKVDSNKLKDAIPKGTEVTIEVGYESTGLNEIFKGFVVRVHPKVPIEIECEDFMWKLKQVQVTENAKDETFQSYLSKVLPYEVDCFDMNLPKFVVNKLTAAQLLDQLKQDYGFPIFVRNGKVVVGKQYDPQNLNRHLFVLDNNSNSNIKSQNLEYTSKDDLSLKVTAISNMSNGEKVEVTIGQSDGEERTLNFFDLKKEDLQKAAEKEMERIQYDGFRGDFVAFGVPLVKHGDIITLRNDQESDKTGEYYVDGIVYEFGVEGFQQTISPGPRT